MHVKIKFFFFIIMLFPFFLVSQTIKETWTYHNPKPQEKGLYAVFVADSLTVFAAGEEGTIIRTKDKGKNWDILSSGTNKKINSLQNTKIGNIRSCWFINENKGFICDSNGKLYMTEDGGITWLLQYHERPEFLNKLFFIDDTTGWAAGTIIIKTTDGGMTWEKVETDFNDEFNDIYFLNDCEGWMAGENGTIICTSDSGNKWHKLNYVTQSTISHIMFFDKYYGIVATYEEVSYTIDGGTTWYLDGMMNKGIKKIHYNDGTGLMVNDNGEMFKIITSNNKISIVSYAGNSIRDLLAIDFYDENHGWIVGHPGRLLYTTNGGKLWKEKSIDFFPFEPFGDIEFKDLNNGWILDTRPKNILHTSDGGESWETQTVDPGASGMFTKIFVKDNGDIWISGEGLYKSTNNGETWQKHDINGLWLTDVLFTNDTLGFATAWYSSYRTTDGGDTWELIPEIGGSDINGIHFADDSTGWIKIKNGRTLYYTTNGGETWESNKDLPYTILALRFINRNEGWYSYDLNNIYKTTDGGWTWENKIPDFWCFKYSTISPWKFNDDFEIIWDINFITKDHGWFIGRFGLLVEYKREVITEQDINNNEEPLTPEFFNLTQNYPNPFNTETTIKYDVKENARTVIKIYNIQGQEIKTLINEDKYAGSYYVKWNGRDNSGAVVSSGIYICTMKTNKYVKSIKLVFIK